MNTSRTPRNLKLAAFIVIMALSALSAAAYTITGSVVDEENLPLPAATVRLVTAKDSTYVSAVTTQDNGRFAIRNITDGNYKLIASYLG